ncbi:hypothetical protein FRC08_007158 [Ceratobasidium sp. 394]|nr:hypothetical protein FRC08_007158 [Ceratobasidium sp. 394]
MASLKLALETHWLTLPSLILPAILKGCLNKNTYSPEKCDAQLRSLYECCAAMYEKSGENAESSACPIPRIVTRWLKNRPD